jgi:hypothetical protein
MFNVHDVSEMALLPPLLLSYKRNTEAVPGPNQTAISNIETKTGSA